MGGYFYKVKKDFISSPCKQLTWFLARFSDCLMYEYVQHMHTLEFPRQVPWLRGILPYPWWSDAITCNVQALMGPLWGTRNCSNSSGKSLSASNKAGRTILRPGLVYYFCLCWNRSKEITAKEVLFRSHMLLLHKFIISMKQKRNQYSPMISLL